MPEGDRTDRERAKREELVRFRVTVEEKGELEEAAQRAGHTLSAWLRALALKLAREGSGGR